MKFSTFTIVSLAFLCAVSASAGDTESYSVDLYIPSSPDCGYVRLDEGRYDADGSFDSSVNSMKHVPLIDQTTLNICYSATATQMIDAWRFSHGEKDYGKGTSYFAAAIDTGEDPDLVLTTGFFLLPTPVTIVDLRRSNVDWGQVGDVVKYLRKGHACDVRSLSKGPDALDQGKLLADLVKNYTDYRLWKSLKGLYGGKLPIFTGTDAAAREHFAQAAVSCMKTIGYATDQIPQLADLARVLTNENPMLFVQKQVNAACKKSRFKVEIPAPTEFDGTDKAALRKRVDTLLDKSNPQPLAISFCGNILKEGSGFKSNCWGHAALITGRRFNPMTNSCELLVRNSWGKSCAYAKDSDVNCVEGTGNLWIKADVLLKNTWKLTNLE